MHPHSLNRSGATGLLLAAGMLLAGCASTARITAETRELVARQRAELASTPTCCESIGDIAFRQLGDGLERFELSAVRARRFAQGSSHFAAVGLADFDQPTYLLVKSHPVVWRRHGLPYIFSPSIAAFDRSFVASGEWIDIPLCYSQGWSALETGYFGLIRVDPRRHRNLLFFTTPSALERCTHYGNSATGAGIGYAVTIDVRYDFPHSPVGELEVGFLPQALEAYLRQRCPILFVEPAGQ